MKVTKGNKLRADYINIIKSSLLNKIKMSFNKNDVKLNYYDINGNQYSGYIVSVFLDNDKLYFKTDADEVLTSNDVSLNVLNCIIKQMS